MGRAIRKAEDRAFILLLDDRLLTHTYKQCLPPTFIPFTAADSNRTANQVKRFFKRHPDAASAED
jgi:Rad3-related DNA helicase